MCCGRIGPDEELLHDAAKRYAVRYLFIEAIQIAIDAAHHVIASEHLVAPKGWRTPSSRWLMVGGSVRNCVSGSWE